MEDIDKKKEMGKWMEEYETCSCSYVSKTKKGLLGYCPIHGNDRRYIYHLPEAVECGLS